MAVPIVITDTSVKSVGLDPDRADEVENRLFLRHDGTITVI